MQWLKRIRGASTGSQLLVAGVIALVLSVFLVIIYIQFFNTSYGTLFSRLRPADAAAIIAELDRRKIVYHLEDHGSTILVPSELVDSTRLNVMSEDIPLKGAVGFELFNKSDMGLTDFAQKINYQRALQGELARTIMTIDAIESARVHLSLSEPTIFRADRVPPKASVSIISRVGDVLAPDTVAGIQRLVAASVPDLDISNVVIVDGHGRVVSNNQMAVENDALPPAMQQQKAIEASHAARIRQAIAKAGYADAITVTVQVLAALQPTDDNVALATTDSKRSYGLLVTLTPHRAMAETVRSDIQNVVESTIAADPTLGDVVTFGALVPQSPVRIAHAAEPENIAASSKAAAVEHPDSFPWVTAFMIGLGLIVTVILFISRHKASRVASLNRRAYVSRFNSLLEEEDADAVHQA